MTLRLRTLLPVVAIMLSTTAITAPAFAADDVYGSSTTTTSSTTSTAMNDTAPSAGGNTWIPNNMSGVYLAAQAGGAFPTGDLDNSGVYAAALGWQFNPMIRAEVEFGYRNSGLSDFVGHEKTYTYMVNGFYDFKNSSAFTPYLGGGIGWAYNNLRDAGYKDDDSAFVYQLGAGVSYAMTPNFALTADYRWVDTMDFDHNGPVGDDDYSASEVRGGVRYTF